MGMMIGVRFAMVILREFLYFKGGGPLCRSHSMNPDPQFAICVPLTAKTPINVWARESPHVCQTFENLPSKKKPDLPPFGTQQVM